MSNPFYWVSGHIAVPFLEPVTREEHESAVHAFFRGGLDALLTNPVTGKKFPDHEARVARVLRGQRP